MNNWIILSFHMTFCEISSFKFRLSVPPNLFWHPIIPPYKAQKNSKTRRHQKYATHEQINVKSSKYVHITLKLQFGWQLTAIKVESITSAMNVRLESADTKIYCHNATVGTYVRRSQLCRDANWRIFLANSSCGY